jgi:hypothetical protein
VSRSISVGGDAWEYELKMPVLMMLPLAKLWPYRRPDRRRSHLHTGRASAKRHRIRRLSGSPRASVWPVFHSGKPQFRALTSLTI